MGQARESMMNNMMDNKGFFQQGKSFGGQGVGGMLEKMGQYFQTPEASQQQAPQARKGFMTLEQMNAFNAKHGRPQLTAEEYAQRQQQTAQIPAINIRQQKGVMPVNPYRGGQ
jgi:hypothetical protein